MNTRYAPKSGLRLILILALSWGAISIVGCQAETPPPEIQTNPPEAEAGFPSVDPVTVREAAVAYLQENHSDELGPKLSNLSWEAMPEPGTHSFAVFGFKTDSWQISLSVLPANLVEVDGETSGEDAYDISLSYLAPPPFIRWAGLYTASGGIREQSYAYRTETLPRIAPEQVRDLAFQTLRDEHPEAVELVSAAWELIGTQAGQGEMVSSYISGDWTVTVAWSEYTRAFSVYGLYESSGDQYVEVEWDATVSADGSSTSVNHFMYFGGE